MRTPGEFPCAASGEHNQNYVGHTLVAARTAPSIRGRGCVRLPIRLIVGSRRMARGWYAGCLMPWLSLPEFSRRTGTPESSVRAAIRKGTLRAELEQRAPGDPRTVWRVWIDDPQEAAGSAADVRMAPETDQPQSAATEPPAAITGLLELVRELRQQGVTDASLIADLRERAGRAETERDLLTQEVARLRARRWWRWWA